ncbi:hypothetical protein PIB30_093296, partial [Stylosanthes scabra]|nr:hypothetical protein [Stylosanthes scabra]
MVVTKQRKPRREPAKDGAGPSHTGKGRDTTKNPKSRFSVLEIEEVNMEMENTTADTTTEKHGMDHTGAHKRKHTTWKPIQKVLHTKESNKEEAQNKNSTKEPNQNKKKTQNN